MDDDITSTFDFFGRTCIEGGGHLLCNIPLFPPSLLAGDGGVVRQSRL